MTLDSIHKPASTTRPSRHWSVHLTVLVGLWLLPALVIAAVLPLTAMRERASLSSPEPSTVQAGARTDSSLTGVVVSFETRESAEIAGSAGGTVTKVAIKPGSTITQGMTLATVDNQRVIAFVASSPLYRDLRLGNSGADVSQLTRFLAARKHLSKANVGSTYTVSVRDAVLAFQRSIHTPATGVFDLAHVAFVPSSVTEVAQVDIRVGQRITSDQALFSAPPEPASMSITTVVEGGDLNALADKALAMSAGDERIELTGLDPDLEEQKAVFAALSEWAESGAVGLVTDAGITRFEGASLSASVPESYAVVPASAVFVTVSGRKCVFVDDDGVPRSENVENVAPAPGEVAEALIDESFAGVQVYRVASTVDEEIQATCG
jgi:hypothetical protein